MENIVNEPALEYDYISPEEYLDIERTALEKHEYFNGKVLSIKKCLYHQTPRNLFKHFM